MAELERCVIIERVRAGMRRAKLEGHGINLGCAARSQVPSARYNQADDDDAGGSNDP